MSQVDLNRLSEVIAEVAAVQPKEKEIKYSSQELQECVAELVSETSAQEAGHVVADIVFERLADEAPKRDLSGLLIPYQGMYPLGDGPVFERWGEPVLYWLGDEAKHMQLMSTEVTKESFTMTFDSIYVRFDFNVDLLAAGKYGDFADHISKAKNQFVGAGNMLMWKALQAAKTSGPGYSSGTLTWTTMSKMVDFVEDESEMGTGAFFGRQTTLSAMSNWLSSASPADDTNLFSDTKKDEIWRNKTLLTFRGVPIVPLPKQKVNVSPNKVMNAGFTGIEAIPKGNIFCIPKDKFGVFAEEGPLAVVNSTEAGSRTFTYTSGRRMGVVIFDPTKIARHVIT